jgi:hypothetical protein
MTPCGVINYFGEIFYSTDLPLINDKINKTIKIKNKIFAIPAAPAAMPPNPNIAAIIATTRKIIVQRNICADLS